MSDFSDFPAAPEIITTGRNRPNGNNSPWTEARTELAVGLWKGGMSATEIARTLHPPTTRNAVIGKIARMGLRRGPAMVSRMKATNGEQVGAKIRRYKDKKRAPWYFTDLEPEVVGHPVLLVDLENYHCRWPVGQDGIATLFCGGEAVKSYSYCTRHCRMAYQPPEARRRRA